MNEDIDLSELELEEPSAPSVSYSELQEKAIKTVHEAMKDVRQEILLTLPDRTVHMCYVNKINMHPDGLVEVLFSTPSESRKAELAEHVEACVKIQIEQIQSQIPKRKWYNIF